MCIFKKLLCPRVYTENEKNHACVYLRNYNVRVCIFTQLKSQGVYIVTIDFSGVYIEEIKNWGTGKQMATLKTRIFNI